MEISGDRATFYPADSQEPLRVLENLALERVVRILSQSRGDQEWLVTGVVTEYRGANFLLVTKAQERAKRTPGAK
jgi:hypothetical protein